MTPKFLLPLPTFLLLSALLPGCIIIGDDDSASDDDSAGDDDDVGDDDDDAGTALILTTDYVDTDLATVDLATGALLDPARTLAGGDFIARVEGGDIYLLGRFGLDSVTRHPDGDVAADPDLQFSTGAGTNPHDLALCGDNLFVTLYEENTIAVRDAATGGVQGSIDLSAFVDTDDKAEPDSLRVVGGLLYASLQRMERGGDFWTPAIDGGRLVEIDCDTFEVLRDWVTGPSPTLHGNGETLLVRTGTYWAEDGDVSRFDASGDGSLTPMRTETDVTGDILDVALGAAGWALPIYDFVNDESRVECYDNAGTMVGSTAVMASAINSIAAGPDGNYWVSVRSSWADPKTPAGVMRLDSTCTEVGGDWIATSMQPAMVAFVP